MKYPEEIVFNIDEHVLIDKNKINELVNKAKKNIRRRSRFCAHTEESDSLHEMFIVHEKNTYIRPHKHINKTESFHLIDGEIDVILFNEDGEVLDKVCMGDYKSGKTFFYRIKQNVFHTLIIKSKFVVFHEITNGPFIRENTIWADWSPSEDDNQEKIQIFTESIVNG